MGENPYSKYLQYTTKKERGRYLKKCHIFTAFGCFQQNWELCARATWHSTACVYLCGAFQAMRNLIEHYICSLQQEGT